MAVRREGELTVAVLDASLDLEVPRVVLVEPEPARTNVVSVRVLQ